MVSKIDMSIAALDEHHIENDSMKQHCNAHPSGDAPPPALLSGLAGALCGFLQQAALLLRALLQLSRHARLLRLKGCTLCRSCRLRLLALPLGCRLHLYCTLS